MSQLGRPTTFYREAGSGSRNKSERICLIVNPRAGAGRAGARLDELKQAVDRAFEQWEVRLTEGPRHATALAAEAALSGARIVAAVGGDGTCHEVVNGLFDGDQPRAPQVIFTTIPFGTGSDLQKTLCIPRPLHEALWIAATGITLPSDVGHVELTTDSGTQTELFINVAGFGTNGAVVRLANKMDKRWGGTATFFAATLRASLDYKAAQVTVRWESPDGPGTWTGKVTSGFISNGAYCGGGMWVGKGGTMQDGHFDLTILPEAPLPRLILESRRLYDGTIEKITGAVRVRASRIDVSAPPEGEIFLDLDGESPGKLAASFRVLPRALHVRGGWLHNPVT